MNQHSFSAASTLLFDHMANIVLCSFCKCQLRSLAICASSSSERRYSFISMASQCFRDEQPKPNAQTPKLGLRSTLWRTGKTSSVSHAFDYICNGRTPFSTPRASGTGTTNHPSADRKNCEPAMDAAEPTSPVYSPGYEPTSPDYEPTSPGYSPNSSPRGEKRKAIFYEESSDGAEQSEDEEDEQDETSARISYKRYKRIARGEMRGLRNWIENGNRVAASLIRLAYYAPTAFTSVENYESKLYSATTNVVWVHEGEGAACMMSFREASGLAAFLSSMIGETKRKDYMDGPYCGAPTGDELPPGEENEMHRLLRGLGFNKREVPENQFAVIDFWKELQRKYYCYSTCNSSARAAGEAAFERDRSLWENAVLAWAGELW